MIELRTGVPGSGKTLSAVQQLAILVKRWERHPEEARPIFVLGIPDLILPHSPLPLKSVQVDKSGTPMLVPDWELLPDGSLILIDEAQGVFPPRSTASKAPEHVAFLNVHRHKGFDIWLTTQHPKLIDGSVRALVGKHLHYRRLFGGSRAVVYEWDSCSDSLSGLKTAVTTYWPYPKRVFDWYKSAEIHTKQRFKLPTWLLIPIVGVVMAVVFVPRAAAVLKNGVSGQGVSTVSKDDVEKTLLKNASMPASSVSVTKSLEPAQAGALAPSRAGESDLTKPYKKTDQHQEEERPVSKLKIEYGVYADNSDLPAHYTQEELQKQTRNAQILQEAESKRLERISEEVRAQLEEHVPVTFNNDIVGNTAH